MRLRISTFINNKAPDVISKQDPYKELKVLIKLYKLLELEVLIEL